MRLFHGSLWFGGAEALSAVCQTGTANHSMTFVNKKSSLNFEPAGPTRFYRFSGERTNYMCGTVGIPMWNTLARTQVFLKEEKGNHTM